MSSFLGVVAVLVFFPMLIAGGITFSAWREGDYPAMLKPGAIFLCCLLVVFIVPRGKGGSGGGDCYIDWDKRSNSTVCD